MRGLALSPKVHKDGGVDLLLSLLDNSLEAHRVPGPSAGADKAVQKTSVLDLHGHRADVRAVSVSADGLLIATCSSEGIKVSLTHPCRGRLKEACLCTFSRVESPPLLPSLAFSLPPLSQTIVFHRHGAPSRISV